MPRTSPSASPSVEDSKIRPLSLLPEMARIAGEMVHDVLDAFAARDAAKAAAVCERDAAVDDFYNSIFRALLTHMMENPHNITPATHLLFVAKNLERIGDHATNVAEMVYFAATGEHLGDRAKGADTDRHPGRTISAAKREQGRILLVEDDRALVELLTYHLEREEFEVEATADGEDALLMARESPPDLVILDWMIEGVSGIEVCRRLRRLPETANVPIIMLTARGEEADRIRGLETGADDYVTKPFSPRELVARVGAVLRRVRPGAGRRAAELCRHRDGPGRPQGAPRRRAGRARARPSSGCCAISSSIRGRVFSRERLLDSVWGRDSDIELRTVDVHIRRLRKAINAGGRSDIIRTVRSAGYALDADAACLNARELPRRIV